jgi:hypothetical protein
MHHAYIVTGALTGERTVTLDESLPLKPTRVRLIVEPVESGPPASYHKVMATIRERQRTRIHQPRSATEVNAALQTERDSWDD